MKFFYLLILSFLLISCPSRVAVKSSNRLLDEFRVDEYRGYVVTKIDPLNKKYANVSMYSQEKKRFVLVKIPLWLSEYWQEGDTVK